jgi:hypothetical protein
MFSTCFAALDLEQGRALAWKHPGVPAVLAIAAFSDWRFRRSRCSRSHWRLRSGSLYGIDTHPFFFVRIARPKAGSSDLSFSFLCSSIAVAIFLYVFMRTCACSAFSIVCWPIPRRRNSHIFSCSRSRVSEHPEAQPWQ